MLIIKLCVNPKLFMASHIERIIRIYNRLRRGPVTIEILTKWAKTAGIDVSTRQLYRDISQLKILQIAEGENVVEFTDEKNRKTWKMEYKAEAGKLTSYDINSFFLLKNFAPFAVLEERKASIEKIEKLFYKDFSKNEFEKYLHANELFLRHTNYNENKYGAIEHQQIEDLIWTLHNSRIIVIDQDLINPANNKLDTTDFPMRFYPMELVFHRGRIAIAGINEKQKLLNFAIDKNLKFTLTNEQFNRKKYAATYKKDFENLYGLTNPINNKVYNIKLEFTHSYGSSMKSFYWHHSEKWTLLKNGNYMLHLQCGIGRELVGFIAIGLDKIKVHQPKILKDLMIKKFTQSAEVNEKNIELDEDGANGDY